MNTIKTKIAAVLAFLVGAMSIVAGGRAMQGWDPGYLVLNWLPVYNFSMGFLSVIVAILIWKNNRYAKPAAIGVLGAHVIVELLLLTQIFGASATTSVYAMLFRIVVWLIVLGLMFPQAQKNKSAETLKLI